MTKILPCRFKQPFGHLKMLTVHKCSHTLFFFHLSNPAFCSLYFSETNNFQSSSFFSTDLKFYVDCGIEEKNRGKGFWFWDNCIWISCVKHSLLLRENTFHPVSICEQTVSRFQILLKTSFLNWLPFRVIKRYDKKTAAEI